MNYLEETAEDIRRQLPGGAMPDDSEALLLIYAVLVRAKGTSTTAEDVHDAWTAWMTLRREDHESMVPFAELEPDVRQEDEPFLTAIRAAAGLLDD
jgi:hypothetical protein